MISSIINAISMALHLEFGDRYHIYMEEVKQGLQEPCFFIFCLNPSNQLFVGRRYLRKNPVCIHYFPEQVGHENEECHEVAGRLFLCLELLDIQGNQVRGTAMRYEVADGMLHFFVAYHQFVDKKAPPLPIMEELEEEIAARG